MNVNNIKNGDLINFDMVVPGIFGDQYKGALCSGVVEYAVARAINPELSVQHQSFYPYFKDTVDNVNDPSTYQYIVIRPDPTVSTMLVIGVPWIKPGTLVVTQGRTATVLIGTWEQRFEAPLKDFLNNLGASFTLRIDDK